MPNLDTAPAMQQYGLLPDAGTTEYAYGFLGTQSGDCPSDGLSRRVPLYLLDSARPHRRMELGEVRFGGDGRQTGASLDGIAEAIRKRWLPDDPRVLAFLSRYPQKLPDLQSLQLQREYPLQFPFFGGLSLQPGDVEVVY